MFCRFLFKCVFLGFCLLFVLRVGGGEEFLGGERGEIRIYFMKIILIKNE